MKNPSLNEEELKRVYYSLIEKYKGLQKKESFSGWAILDEIEKAERELNALNIDY